MIRSTFARGLLAATALSGGLAMATAAHAQEQAAPTMDEMASQIEMLQAQITALQKAMEKQRADATRGPVTDMQGAARVRQSNGGWVFKPRGTFQWDTYYSSVNNRINESAGTPWGLGSGFRRALLGVDGTIPGGFSYSVEFNLANSSVGYEDVLIRYAAAGSPWTFTAGYQKFFPGMDDLTSNRFTSFMERAAFVDAFNLGRALGVSARYRQGDMSLFAGAFVEGTALTGTRDNNGFILGGRGVYNPRIGLTQYHGALWGVYRQQRSGDQSRNRQANPTRTQANATTFASTGSLAQGSDILIGGELFAINGPWSIGGELVYNTADIITPTDVLTGTKASGGTRLGGNVDFLSGYAEVLYSFTGETRGYNAADGRFDRVRPAKPLDKDGLGALTGGLRFEYLDLSDTTRTVQSGTGVTAGPCVVANTGTTPTCFLDGGKQWSLLANLSWVPVEYVRFILQYGYTQVNDAPAATGPAFTAVGSRTSTNPARALSDYSTNTLGLRMQLDW
jgi:phosphate-selective porin OprO and OprP